MESKQACQILSLSLRIHRPAVPCAASPKRAASSYIVRFLRVEIKPWRESREERNIGLIGRLVCVVSAIAALGFGSAVAAAAAPTGVSHVTWHGNGLLTWERVEHRAIAPKTIHRLSISMAPGQTKVVDPGRAGVLEAYVRYTQRDGGPVHSKILASAVTRPPQARIVAEGIGGTPLTSCEAHSIAGMASMARSAMEMLATAYTAECAGCGGMTAIGRRAGKGIVAVDPRVIPIGTRLFIPGYGFAVAGDTGGDIVGNRIDLGFDSWHDAMLFGRRDVKVYRLP
jgi:3D (Asp-Asp-Asp) domain-containing protein